MMEARVYSFHFENECVDVWNLIDDAVPVPIYIKF